VLLAAAIERLYDLRVGTTPVEEGTPHEKPCSGASVTAAVHLAAGRPMKPPTNCRPGDRRCTTLPLSIHHSKFNIQNPTPPAAHLIPFSESQNDHPTNGLAICKNHHWAMDRNLIAPAPDHHWHVPKIRDPRRSNWEKELIALSGQSLLLPQDEVFHPDAEGLRWRYERLIA